MLRTISDRAGRRAHRWRTNTGVGAAGRAGPVPAVDRLRRRRRLRHLGSDCGAPHEQAHPRQPDNRAAKCAGGGQLGRGLDDLRGRAQGRHDVFALISRDAPLGPITNQPGARFDPTKMSWLGTPTRETNVCVAYHTARVKTVKDLYEHELIMGDVGPGSGTRVYPKALTGLLGMKFKLVGGYKSSADVMLAMQRDEVQGICESFDSIRSRRPDWLAEEDHQHPVPGRGRSQPRSAGRSADSGPCPQHRGAAGDRLPLRRPGHRPAVRGASRACRPTASRCCARHSMRP